MHSLMSRSSGLALVYDGETSTIVDLFAAKLHCVMQRVDDRMLALEIARRSRPVMVIVDGDLLDEYLEDFLSRIRARRPTMEIVIIRNGTPELCA